MWFICFTLLQLNPILCGIRFIAVHQAIAYLVMDMECHLYLSCKVILVYSGIY